MRNQGAVWDGQTGGKNDLQRGLGRKPTPDAEDWEAIVGEIVATQRGLTQLGTAIKSLQQRLADSPEENTALTDLAAAIQALCTQRDDLLCEFNGIDDMLHWAQQARRFRHLFARVQGEDPSDIQFTSEQESIKGYSPDARQGYENGRSIGYRAGYAAGYAEASKGLPCRLELPNSL